MASVRPIQECIGNFMKRVVITVLIALAVPLRAEEFPLAKTEPAKNPPLVVDPSKDFHFELGRGSGWAGLDTVAFGRDGVVTMFRQHPEGKWETTSLRLSPQAISRILDVMAAEGIMKMPAAYHADVQDGTQWVLWFTQNRKSKATYFDNYFPSKVRQLAAQVDVELVDAGLAHKSWKKVPAKEFRAHEIPLWNSIK